MTIVLAQLGTPEDVGLFALGLAMTAPIFMFATLRLRDVQAVDTKQEYQFEDYFALRLITTTLAVLTVAGVVAVSKYSGEAALVILATAASKGTEAASDVFYGLFMQQERLDRIAKSMMVKGPLSLIGLTIGFYLTDSVFWGVVGLTLARLIMTIGYDLRNATLTLDPAARANMGLFPKDFPRPRWHRQTLTRLTLLALPLGFVTMLISLNVNIPRYFIENQLGAYALGIFAAVSSFQKVAPTVVQALGRSASPRLAKYHAALNVKGFRRLTLRLIGMGLALAAGGVLVALVIGRPLLTLIYGEEYVIPGLFVLIMIGAGADYVGTMLLVTITAARYFRVQLPLQLITTATMVVACFLLIPRFQLLGAGIAILVSNMIKVVGISLVALHAQRALRQAAANAPSQPADGLLESAQTP